MGPRFVADRMLGRLARMLRLLGYDTLYSPTITLAQLQGTARQGNCIILTRGHSQKRFPALLNVYSVRSENPAEQLRDIVEQFHLDTRAGLWTRCTLCNALIQKVEKDQVRNLLEPKILQLYEEFFRCTGCAHIYWRGSHVERITENLQRLLGPKVQ
jgi:uncharacterized protein